MNEDGTDRVWLWCLAGFVSMMLLGGAFVYFWTQAAK